jgi:hypothetical protein
LQLGPAGINEVFLIFLLYTFFLHSPGAAAAESPEMMHVGQRGWGTWVPVGKFFFILFFFPSCPTRSGAGGELCLFFYFFN